MHRCLIFVRGLMQQYLDFKSIFLVLFLSLMWWQCNRWYESYLFEQQAINFDNRIQSQSENLSKQIANQLWLLNNLSLFVKAELKTAPAVPAQKASAFLSGLRSSNPSIRNFAIAPNGIINFISPLLGNEEALGHAIIDDTRSHSANASQRVASQQRLALTDPLQLLQGGLGVVARQSIIHKGKHWGLVSITIDILPLLTQMGMLDIDNNYHLGLRDSKGRVFHGDANIFKTASNIHRVNLADGYWEIAAQEIDSGSLELDLKLLIFQYGFAALIILLLCTVIILHKKNSSFVDRRQNRDDVYSRNPSKQPSWLAPGLATLALVISSVSFYWFLQEQNSNSERNELEANLNNLELNVSRELQANKNFFTLLAEQIANHKVSSSRYQSQVSAYVKNHPGLINVTWADRDFIIRDTAPFEANKHVLGLLLSLPEPQRVSRLAYSSRQAQYTKPFVIIQGSPAIELYLPIFDQSKFLGTLGLVYSLNQLMKAAVPEHLHQRYKIELLDRNGAVFYSNLQQSYPHFYKSKPIDALQRELWLRLSPQQLNSHQSMQQLLLVAFLMILGIGISLWLQFRESHILWSHNEELQQSQEHFRAIAQSSPMAIVITTQASGEIIYANSLAEKSLRGRHKTILGNLAERYCENYRELKSIYNKISNGKPIENFELMLKNGSGQKFWASVSVKPVQYDNQEAFITSITDLSERKKHEDKLFQQANYDSLTGLPNRGLAFDRLQRAMIRAKRDCHQVFLMMIDLDHFKIINDKFGHNTGDQVLQKTAERLSQCLRPGDTVARLGGDEFTIILPELNNIFKAEHIAEKIIAACSQTMSINDHEFKVSASIGITVYPDDGADSETLLKNADVAMYKCKEDGRNHYRFYTEEMNQSAQLLLSKEIELRQALSRGELSLNYQPLISSANHKIEGAEALLRWNSEKFGQVSPAEFIPMAENMGIINELGEWVLTTACEKMKQWHLQECMPRYISVNVSGKQFRQGKLPSLVANTLRRVGLPAVTLQLEITESVLIDNTAETRRTLDIIHDMGVNLAIDDFGTGYSSLSYLRSFPFDTLKIDRAFINDIPGDQEAEQLVNAIISMANILGLKTVAEGVETPQQQEYLSQRDCAVLQGFHLSRPLSVDDFERYCKNLKQPTPN